jgi:hypothetical protein
MPCLPTAKRAPRSRSSENLALSRERRPNAAETRVDELTNITLTDEQRLDWLRLIRSENVGPRGIMAQTPPR